MKRTLLLFTSVIVCLTVGAQSSSKYDVNGDGSVNAADIVAITNYIMGNSEETKAPVGAVAVDLGLPSGTMWANMNVGAENPEDYGLYFAWGETTGYGTGTSDGHSFDWANYKWCNGSRDTQTKYCTDESYGTVDNKTVLDLEDDAAYVNWGEQWRMPTIDEINELLNNTTAEWTYVNEVCGRKFTGSNGNYIFLPAAGYRTDKKWMSYYDDQDKNGEIWSASLYTVKQDFAHRLIFMHGGCSPLDNCSRFVGLSVRPVLRK
jgi:hypothetical protein